MSGLKNLSDLMVDAKSVWVDFEGMSPFKVELSYIPRTEMAKLVESSMEGKMSRSSRTIEQKLNAEKFIDKFVKRAILNWDGLTMDILSNFLPIEVEEEGKEKTLDFTTDNAKLLIRESQLFDDWVNEKISDIETFR